MKNNSPIEVFLAHAKHTCNIFITIFIYHFVVVVVFSFRLINNELFFFFNFVFEKLLQGEIIFKRHNFQETKKKESQFYCAKHL